MSDIWHDPLFLAAVKKGGAGGTASGDIVTFNAPKAAPLKALTLSIDPVQDLHGYDSPWPGGGGANVLDPNITLTSEEIDGVTLTTTDGYQFKVVGTATGSSASIFRSELIPFGSGKALKAGTYSLPTGITAQIRKQVNGNFLANANGTFTAEEDFYVCQVWYIVSVGATVDLSRFIGLAVGSTPPTSWTPYSNLCPISGWDGANVWRTGRNLLDLSFLEFDDSTYSHAYYPATTPQVTDYVKLMERFIGKTVVLSATVTGTQSAGTQPIGTIRLVNSSGDVFQLRPDTPATVPDMDYSNVSYLIIYGSTNGASVSDIQLELGSTATPYTPYTGTTIPVTFTEAGTVYGGTLDVLSGVLRVDRAMASAKKADFSGKITGSAMDYRQAGPFSPTASMVDWNKARQQQISNMAKIANPNNEGGYGRYVAVVYTLAADTSIGSLRISEDLYQSMSDDDEIEVVYKLLNPIEYTLTASQQLDTLAGQNVVWGDAGEVDLEYAGGGVSKDMMLAAILHEARQ